MADRKRGDNNNGNGCICDPCPSYNECMRAGGDLRFCSRGMTPDCTFDRKGCLCPSCPVQPARSRGAAYYCVRGSKQDQN